MAELKSRKPRKVTKPEKATPSKASQIDDDEDREMESTQVKRRPARKEVGSKSSMVRPLPPSAGMGDVAARANAEILVEEDDFLTDRKRTQVVEDMPEDPTEDAEGFFAETPAIEYEHVEHTHMASGFHAKNLHGTLASSNPEDQEVIIETQMPTSKKTTAKSTAKESQTAKDEGDLLAPEYQSFNLESKKRRSAVATFFIWFLDILIVLGIVALFLLYKFPSQSEAWITKLVPKFGNQQQTSQTNSTPAATTTNSNSPVVFRTASTVTALAQAVDAAVGSANSTMNITTSSDVSEISSLNLANDTVLYKSASQSQAQSIATLVNQKFGIQPQLQEDDTLTEDIVLFLTTTVKNPNLSSDVAIVYNGNGTSGIAKQYCGYLTTDKIGSCSSANAPSPTTGLSVSYKNQAAYATLIRTAQFANATFQQAPDSQVQDIAVTVGK